jgi:UDP-N-acetylmuramoylalanine--D-glutamate ligase
MRKKDLINKNIAILGFGAEGRDIYKYLKEINCNITICDQKDIGDLDFRDMDKRGVEISSGNDYLQNLTEYDIIFRSPGVYRFLPEIVEAEKRGSIVTSGIKYFLENCPAKTIGVTGTKGKGTTSTLIYNILKKDGKDACLLGNIGKPPLEVLDRLDDNSIVVLELSSFQLIDIEKSPNISVVLNITSDHLDWHKDQNEYVDAKKNIVIYQNKSDFAVINNDYSSLDEIKTLGKAKKYYFSTKEKVNGCYVEDGNIYLNIHRYLEEIGSIENMILRGKHNQENVTAAICASALAGASVKSIKSVVYSFKGLEHRLEFVKGVGGIGFYNDSFSTNPQTVEAAVKSFDEPTTLILGGFDKKIDYGDVFKMISKRKNVVCVVLIGDMANRFQTLFKKHKFQGRIINLGHSKMKNIVKEAYKNTPKGGVVVLTPGCSSFDMFENYKERGDGFKKEVESLT